MRHDLDARVAGAAGCCFSPVARRVVDDEDPIDEIGNALDRRRDEGLLVVGGNDHPHGPVFQHQREGRRMSGSHSNAASSPISSPRNAATTTEFLRLRAVVFTAAARVSTFGFSTSCAWMSSCFACSW